MNRSACAVFCVFAASLAAQTTASSHPDPALVARLEAPIPVVMAGPGVQLKLTVTARRDTEIPVRALAGQDLVTRIGDQPGPTFQVEALGTVPIAAGTRIERTVELDFSGVQVPSEGGKLTDVAVEWRGLPGASTTLRVAPDLRGLDLRALDLSKTKVLLVTSHGNMIVTLRPDKAPKTVENFVKLSKDGFYNGTKFHRVIRTFMIQGGCPNTKPGATGMPGTGNPGYTIEAEFNDLRHARGVLSMARMNDPNSAGCQFFIMTGERPDLDGRYTAFAQLESGLDTLQKIADVPVTYGNEPQPSKPTVDVILHAAIVLPARQ